MVVDPTRWADLFKGNVAVKDGVQTLSDSNPVLLGDRQGGEFGEDDVCDALEKWQRTLMGYVIGANSVGKGLVPYLRWLWRLSSMLAVKPRGSGFFLFQFSNEVDLMKVLERGPLFIMGRPLITKLWTLES